MFFSADADEMQRQMHQIMEQGSSKEQMIGGVRRLGGLWASARLRFRDLQGCELSAAWAKIVQKACDSELQANQTWLLQLRRSSAPAGRSSRSKSTCRCSSRSSSRSGSTSSSSSELRGCRAQDELGEVSSTRAFSCPFATGQPKSRFPALRSKLADIHERRPQAELESEISAAFRWRVQLRFL